MAPEDRPTVKHQTGARTADEARAAYADSGVEVELCEYIEDMAAAYAWADVVVCRAGALTVAEVCAAGLPAIFIPFPHAVDDHQTANAQPLAAANAAIIIDESELTPASLAEQLTQWLQGRPALVERANKARGVARPEALKSITDTCLSVAGVPA